MQKAGYNMLFFSKDSLLSYVEWNFTAEIVSTTIYIILYTLSHISETKDTRIRLRNPTKNNSLQNSNRAMMFEEHIILILITKQAPGQYPTTFHEFDHVL